MTFLSHPFAEYSELKSILSKISGIDEENIQYTKVSRFSFELISSSPLYLIHNVAALHENTKFIFIHECNADEGSCSLLGSSNILYI
jgi:hypothetical protein